MFERQLNDNPKYVSSPAVQARVPRISSAGIHVNPCVVDPPGQHLRPPVDGETGPELAVLNGPEVLVHHRRRLEEPVRFSVDECEKPDVHLSDQLRGCNTYTFWGCSAHCVCVHTVDDGIPVRTTIGVVTDCVVQEARLSLLGDLRLDVRRVAEVLPRYLGGYTARESQG